MARGSNKHEFCAFSQWHVTYYAAPFAVLLLAASQLDMLSLIIPRAAALEDVSRSHGAHATVSISHYIGVCGAHLVEILLNVVM